VTVTPPLDVAQAWAPIHGTHAIQVASAIVTFSEALTSLPWRRAVAAARKSALDLGLAEEAARQSIFLQFAPGAPPAQIPAPGGEEAGLEFFRRGEAQSLSDRLTVDASSLRLDTWTYTRWVGFNEKIKTSFGGVIPIFQDAVSIKSVALEYVDVFIAPSSGSPDCSLLVNRGSEYLSKKAFQVDREWHSHGGWFEGESNERRVLVNADVTVGDANTPMGTRRSVSIRTHEATQFLSSRLDDVSVEAAMLEEILMLLDNHHVSLKARLGDIITPQAAAMISLEGN
jgi:hypothetical protein